MVMGKSNKQNSNINILLVDDSHADQHLIARAIKKAKFDASLFTVNDGEEAIDYLTHKGKFTEHNIKMRPDLVLLDINMPKMDGKEVLKQIRANQDLHTLPVIMLTTSHQEKDILDSYNLGVNAYITKPSTLNGIVRAVNTLEDFWFGIAELPKR